VGVSGELDVVASIGPRRAGSEAERRAARALEKRLRELGRDVVLEPTRVRPSFGLTHLIHAVAGIVASVLSVYVPSAGLILAFLATASTFGDLTGSFHLVRALTPARASQNVVSDHRPPDWHRRDAVHARPVHPDRRADRAHAFVRRRRAR
jgi:hypothetical protein